MSSSNTKDSQGMPPLGGAHPGLDAFQIHDVVTDGEHRLLLRGELDLASAAELNEVLGRICGVEASSVVIDLSELQFMDSTGIHAILSAQALCAAAACEFRLVPGPAHVQRLFEITGLTEALPFARDDSGGSAAERGRLPDAHNPS
jgi:anti-sigma B factor antagonist